MPHPTATQKWHPSTLLERGLYRVFRLASVGSAVTGAGFIGYLSVGIALHITGVYTPPFPVMSFSDPVFVSLSFLIGVLICLLSGSFTVLTHLASVKDANTEFVILMSLIAFGFGAATVRVTAGPVLTLLATIKPV